MSIGNNISDLLQRVWDEDTTLINVLDETGIGELPNIETRIANLESESVQQKSQLDSLGHTVDNYQKSNEASFNRIDTHLIDSDKIVSDVVTSVTSLENDVVEIRSQLATLSRDFEQLNLDVNSQLITINRNVSINEANIHVNKVQIEVLRDLIRATNNRVNSISSFLVDSTAIFQGSEIIIVDIGGTRIEMAETTIGNRLSKELVYPVKFVSRYQLYPTVSFNNRVYTYILFVGSGKTNETPNTQQTVVPWGYQTIMLMDVNSRTDTLLTFILKKPFNYVELRDDNAKSNM